MVRSGEETLAQATLEVETSSDPLQNEKDRDAPGHEDDDEPPRVRQQPGQPTRHREDRQGPYAGERRRGAKTEDTKPTHSRPTGALKRARRVTFLNAGAGDRALLRQFADVNARMRRRGARLVAIGGLALIPAIVLGALLVSANESPASRTGLGILGVLLLVEGAGLITNWRDGASELAALIRGRPPVDSLVAKYLGTLPFVWNTVGTTAVVVGALFCWAAGS